MNAGMVAQRRIGAGSGPVLVETANSDVSVQPTQDWQAKHAAWNRRGLFNTKCGRTAL
jgi:hypothetical protein